MLLKIGKGGACEGTVNARMDASAPTIVTFAQLIFFMGIPLSQLIMDEVLRLL
jgi:hypothetical protein